MRKKSNRGISDTSAVGAALLDALTAMAGRIIRRQLRDCEIAELWTERDRVLFRLRDGGAGDVQVLVNWDVGASTTPEAD